MNARLTVRGLQVSRGERDVLRGVDFHVAPGEVCALMGVSGAGKTTVLRAIAALQPFTAGTIVLDDFTLKPGAVPPESRLGPLRRSVGMVFQGQSLFEHLTAVQNVALAPIYVYRMTPDQAHELAHKLLTSLGVASRAGAFPRDVSGGEAQRIAIARALAPDPMTLLMDEPTSALDPARRTALGQTLRELASQGRGLLIATHDVEFARAHADRVVVLAGGVVVEQGAASAVLDRPSHAATRELLRSPEPRMTGVSEQVRRPELHGKEHL